jgi:hypothetical protein
MKRAPRPVDREIARFREIVAETNDALLLADGGAASPDAALLDLCAEALHLLTRAEKVRKAITGVWQRFDAGENRDLIRAELDRLREDSSAAVKRAKPLLSRARKLHATTGAGIYAKALVVRASITGAPLLAVSLAEDLVACTELRATLWPSAREGQP